MLDFVSDTFSIIFGVEKNSHHDDCKLQCDAISYSFSGLTATAVAILNHGAIIFASPILYSILIHALARMNMAFLLSSPPLFPTLPPFYEWKLKIGFSDSSVRLGWVLYEVTRPWPSFKTLSMILITVGIITSRLHHMYITNNGRESRVWWLDAWKILR